MKENNLAKSKSRITGKKISGNRNIVLRDKKTGKSLALSATSLAQKKKKQSKLIIPLVVKKPLKIYDILTSEEKNKLNMYEVNIEKSVTPIGVFINKVKAENLLNNAKKRYFQDDAQY
ncbi:hypothetical protein [Psychrobacillus sp. FSL K6-1267]|uniref:hypothetical protein n=1 Tax=Psychrobacillus sp. FSL K6-1267 TaxID=2921543 RepID=UPI0030F4E01E